MQLDGAVAAVEVLEAAHWDCDEDLWQRVERRGGDGKSKADRDGRTL